MLKDIRREEWAALGLALAAGILAASVRPAALKSAVYGTTALLFASIASGYRPFKWLNQLSRRGRPAIPTHF